MVDNVPTAKYNNLAACFLYNKGLRLENNMISFVIKCTSLIGFCILQTVREYPAPQAGNRTSATIVNLPCHQTDNSRASETLNYMMQHCTYNWAHSKALHSLPTVTGTSNVQTIWAQAGYRDKRIYNIGM